MLVLYGGTLPNVVWGENVFSRQVGSNLFSQARLMAVFSIAFTR